MGRHHSSLVRHAEFHQNLSGLLHGVPVGLAAHDDANERWGHVVALGYPNEPERRSVIPEQRAPEPRVTTDE